MGEPLPGDIPDPTHLKTINILLQTDIIGKKGDWLIYGEGSDFWVDVGTQFDERLLNNMSAVQLQQDVDSTGLPAGTVNAAAFGNGSWVYALIGSDVDPNSPVILVIFDSGDGFKVGFANEISATGDVSVSSNVATVVTDRVHGYKLGDNVSVVSANLDESGDVVMISKIIDNNTFEFATTSGDFTSESTTSTYSAKENGGTTKFIKRSGDTYAQKGVKNEIGVFAMTGVGL